MQNCREKKSSHVSEQKEPIRKQAAPNFSLFYFTSHNTNDITFVFILSQNEKRQWRCFAGFQIVISGLCVPIVDPEVKEGRVGVLHNFFQVLILLLQSQYFDCFNFIFSIAFINFKQIPLFIEFHNCL